MLDFCSNCIQIRHGSGQYYDHANRKVAYIQPNKGFNRLLHPVFMESSRPRPSILSLFDPLCLELNRAASPDSDKENDFSDLFNPSGTHKYIHAPPRSLKRRLVDVGDTTVELPDTNTLLSDELEQEISYIVDDDESDTLTFRDMAKAATPTWSPRNARELEMPKAFPPPRTPLTEISLKRELTPLAPKKPYKRQPVFTTSNSSQSACPILPPCSSSDSPSSCPPSHAEVPEVRVDDESALQGSSITANSLGDMSESLSSCTINRSILSEMLVTEPAVPTVILPSPCVASAPSRPQAKTRHLSPMLPADNVNRYSVDLQTSFQIHFPSHDTTFDLLKDKVSFFGSRNEFDSFFNNLEGDSSLEDDISILGPECKVENKSEVSPMVTLNQAQSVVSSVKQPIDHPTPVSKDAGEIYSESV